MYPVEFVPTRNDSRLLAAIALSVLLHLALLLGIPADPGGGVPRVAAPLYARLEPAATEPSQLPQAALNPAELAGVPARAIARPSAPATTVEPQHQSPPAAKELPSELPDGSGIPLSRDPTYYPARQLDVYPRLLAPLKLDYPERAAAQRVDGNLLLLLLIDEYGTVDEASVVEAQPAGYFEAAALSVLRMTRFSPAQKQGRPVKSRVLLQVSYRYDGGAAR